MPNGALRMLAVVGLALSTGVAVAESVQASVTMIELQPLSPQAGVWPTVGAVPRDMNNRDVVLGWVEIASLHYRGVLWR